MSKIATTLYCDPYQRFPLAKHETDSLHEIFCKVSVAEQYEGARGWSLTFSNKFNL